MTQSDLVGWTLAELALILLFAILAAVVPSYEALSERNRSLETASKTAKTQDETVLALQAQNQSLKTLINEYRKNLRSTALPSCYELDKNSDWLFTATILGSDSYEIQGQEYSMNSLLALYAPAIVDAKKRGCVQRVRLYFQAGISASAYDAGFRKMGEHFYPQMLGSH